MNGFAGKAFGMEIHEDIDIQCVQNIGRGRKKNVGVKYKL
jgi:hypothetical protein